jgi:UDP-N-acetylglucosamine 1-carboxyvinyltransferase
MGAQIKVEGRIAVVEGTQRLTGAPVKATDLRGGAAMVIAGLAAEGVTEVHNIKLIDRGYERFEEKLRSLGADIVRVKE